MLAGGAKDRGKREKGDALRGWSGQSRLRGLRADTNHPRAFRRAPPGTWSPGESANELLGQDTLGLEVNYLLQRMEAYRGIAILTTKMKGALDTAFLRRLRFIVDFPFSDLPQRPEIWRRVSPPEPPTDGLDPLRLAQLHANGGIIRNVAFLAADAHEPVRMARRTPPNHHRTALNTKIGP